MFFLFPQSIGTRLTILNQLNVSIFQKISYALFRSEVLADQYLCLEKKQTGLIPTERHARA